MIDTAATAREGLGLVYLAGRWTVRDGGERTGRVKVSAQSAIRPTRFEWITVALP
ncbi:MAG: hypothetical protein KatS3mg060_3345 [Dehalococcoidia bacterium]|nr:MAG: hypothetical protein KatS3mg060_3345 [Dehalococcoidia bacterium]